MREIDDSLPWVLKSGATIHGIGGRHATRKVHRQVRPQPFRLVGDHGTRTNLTAQDAFEELGADAPPAWRTEDRTVPLNPLDGEFAPALLLLESP